MSFFESVKEIISLENLPAPTFRATLIGDNAISLEGVLDVVDFSSESVTVRLKKGGLIIKGVDLYVKKYCAGDLIICGKIISVERI